VGPICSRCGATLASIESCPTRLRQRCPGFLSIERALADYRREQRLRRPLLPHGDSGHSSR
jgi:hypothetical protein